MMMMMMAARTSSGSENDDADCEDDEELQMTTKMLKTEPTDSDSFGRRRVPENKRGYENEGTLVVWKTRTKIASAGTIAEVWSAG